MSAAGHRVATGHLPEPRAASWSCTCGEAEVWDYAHASDAEWALRLMAVRATNHLTTTAIGNPK
jgi:hypothetical protein